MSRRVWTRVARHGLIWGREDLAVLSAAGPRQGILAEELARIGGGPAVDAVYEACTRVGAAVHRPGNPAILTPEEFASASAFLDNCETARRSP